VFNGGDVKELIPEFYSFPEFLLNLNNFNLGQRQVSETFFFFTSIDTRFFLFTTLFVRTMRPKFCQKYNKDMVINSLSKN